GALAGWGARPFPRAAFEAAIRRGQVGVNRSLAAFGAGFEAARAGDATSAVSAPVDRAERDASPALRELLRAAERDFSGEARPVVVAGVDRLVDYQDADYAKAYLTRLDRLQKIERQYGDGSGRLLEEAVRQLALGMSYEETIC